MMLTASTAILWAFLLLAPAARATPTLWRQMLGWGFVVTWFLLVGIAIMVAVLIVKLNRTVDSVAHEMSLLNRNLGRTIDRSDDPQSD